MSFNDGLTSNSDVTLTIGTAGNYNYSINGPVSLTNINVDPLASSNNSFHLNNVGMENWMVNGLNTDTIGLNGVSGTFNFNNIGSAYAGTDANNNFTFAGNTGHFSQLINAGSLNNTNTLNYANYTTPVVYDLIGNINTGTINDGNATQTAFSNVNNISSNNSMPITTTLYANTIQLPVNNAGGNNTVTVASLNQGNVNSSEPYNGIKTFISQTGTDSAVFDVPATLTPYQGGRSFIANINGTNMYFINFPLREASGDITGSGAISSLLYPLLINNLDSNNDENNDLLIQESVAQNLDALLQNSSSSLASGNVCAAWDWMPAKYISNPRVLYLWSCTEPRRHRHHYNNNNTPQM